MERYLRNSITNFRSFGNSMKLHHHICRKVGNIINSNVFLARHQAQYFEVFATYIILFHENSENFLALLFVIAFIYRSINLLLTASNQETFFRSVNWTWTSAENWNCLHRKSEVTRFSIQCIFLGSFLLLTSFWSADLC